MEMVDGTSALRRALGALATDGVVPLAPGRLETDQTRVVQELRAVVVGEITAFLESRNPEILPELERHATEHFHEICRLLEGQPIGPFEFVRTHARRRAEQHFPLETTLHAYRCGHKVFARWMRDVAVAAVPAHPERVIAAIADFALEYTDCISTIVAAEYVARARVIAEAEGDRRAALLEALLRGYDESDGRIVALLRDAGYLQQRQSFCVIVARPRPQLAAELSMTLSGRGLRVLVGLHDDLVTAVCSDVRRISGWTAPQTALGERIAALLRSSERGAIAAGISNDQPSTSHVPRALHEARIALEIGTAASGIARFGELPMRRLALHRSADLLQTAQPAWARALFDVDAKQHGALLKTLQACADANLNIQEAARALEVHPNTIYARLQRIREITALDAQRFHDLNELLLVIDSRGDPSPSTA